MSSEELFYLKWNNFQKNIRRMRDEKDLIDITFACEGKKIGAHKLVLFSCSPYFKNLLKDNPSQHPIFFFQDVAYDTLKAILEYMYLGEVQISNDKLKDFIRIGEALQLRGLSNYPNFSDEEVNETTTANDTDHSGRKRSNTNEDQIHANLPSEKRLRIISEASLGNALHEEEDFDEVEEEIIPNRVSSRITETHNLQPKAETMEFLEEAAQVIQQTQQQTTKQPQSITYMTMDSFTEKAVVNPQQVTQYVQAGTSQQTQHTLEYKSEDEMWVEKAIDGATGTSQTDTSPKTRSSSKNSAAYKANCLTPRSCPVCARVYSNVSNLRQHMRLIHNPTAVICPICQKHFNSDLYLKRHFASIHSTGSNSEAEGAKNESGTNNSDANTSANWSYQSSDGTIQTLQQ